VKLELQDASGARFIGTLVGITTNVQYFALDRAIVTIEQFYPFPEAALAEAMRAFPETAKIVWVQEEPANMGALGYVRPRIKAVVGSRHVTSIKRYENSSPATGSAKAHALEQKALINSPYVGFASAPHSPLACPCAPHGRGRAFPQTFASHPVCTVLPPDCTTRFRSNDMRIHYSPRFRRVFRQD
jgi:hypothetical protein